MIPQMQEQCDFDTTFLLKSDIELFFSNFLFAKCCSVSNGITNVSLLETMGLYVANGAGSMLLNHGFWDEEIFMNNLSGPNAMRHGNITQKQDVEKAM